ncbi:MAG: hypothetical protein IKH45_06225 [Neisseriaceae bacterium]|nr:hypothetical protein [Neisseriaceae bacterium]MBR3482466.1 hypothetical protein [Neisseriaceae bacterium]
MALLFIVQVAENIFALSLYLIGYPKIIFNFAHRSFKNDFWRLPRRALMARLAMTI